MMIFNFGTCEIMLPSAASTGKWITELNSGESRWLGYGKALPQMVSPDDAIALVGQSFVVLRREETN
jgi:hypothetical protein